jgi:N-dimethylarginine dimethylaminohydrolase
MNRRVATDHATAIWQWSRFRDLLARHGADTRYLTPTPDLPDLVFTANAALIFRDLAIVSRFRHAERRGEEPHFERWLTDYGFHIERLRRAQFFEGAGDALFCGSTLYTGYRLRSEIAAHEEIADIIGCRVIPLELVRPEYYHLDTCFCPITHDTALYFPDAFDAYGKRALQASIERLVPVSVQEAERLACNAVVLGQHVIVNSGCDQVQRILQDMGYVVHPTPLGEFIKAGGGAKCLTLRLDGEDAATWRDDPLETARQLS